MKVAYVRVSTIDQNEARQVEALKNYEIEMSIPGLVTPVSGPSETSIPGNRKP